jgi:hypothetical protein
MLNITVPKNYIIEFSYVIKVLLMENLNFDAYEIIASDEEDVIFSNAYGQIKFANVFFKGEIRTLHTKENLPTSCIDFSYNNCYYKSLYKRHDKINAGGNGNIEIGPDIFATTYFLLTQWESTVLDGDHLGRYKFKSSSLCKFGLYGIPVVNQYIQLLHQLLRQININCKIDHYKPHFSCDIDSITKYKSIRNLLGGIYHRGQTIDVIKSYAKSKKNKKNDPYYSFDFLFKILEKCNIDSTFYFMSDFEDSRYDTKDYELYEPLIQGLVKEIKERQYAIGLHPTINTWKSYDSLKTQKQMLERSINADIVDIRQHYLRYDVNTTWSIMERNGFSYDSSMQFTEGMGFAAGMCTPFTLFDIANRKETKMQEIPLIVMKKKDYVYDIEKAYNSMVTVINEAKKYSGRFMLLFHNSDLETNNEQLLFEKVMDAL